MIRRYEHPAPGDLVHVDIKKLGRIPIGGGHRAHGRRTSTPRGRGIGYDYLHAAVDDHSRLAYVELLADERDQTWAGFWRRAQVFFTSHHITVRRVLTDNGPGYRSRAFGAALADHHITHSWTRPDRPQTNGKVERFNRTLLEEWAYRRLYRPQAARARALPAWLQRYNHHRAHTHSAATHQSAASTTSRVRKPSPALPNEAGTRPVAEASRPGQPRWVYP